jgi:hypothetical protein
LRGLGESLHGALDLAQEGSRFNGIDAGHRCHVLGEVSVGRVHVGAADTGGGKIAFIHSDDIADVATTVLTTNRYEGQTLSISGPEALSFDQMVSIIAATIGKPLAFEPISDHAERQLWTDRGESPESVDYHVSIFRAIRDGKLSVVTDAVNRVLGRATVRFQQWATQNASAFRTDSTPTPTHHGRTTDTSQPSTTTSRNRRNGDRRKATVTAHSQQRQPLSGRC